nr:DUF4270 domain-containing protein [uncultured Flavobacterium sp.]
MYKTSFIKKLLLVATVAVFYSCDKDFIEIGDTLIGDNHFGLEPENYDVNAYNQKVTPVASNNLNTNPLGIYDNAVFGTTTANFNTQVALSEYAPTIGEGVEVDSVTINIPYFVLSSKTVINSETGNSTYVLDSVFGPADGKLKLSVYESGYYMRDLDPSGSVQTSQLYYTNQNVDFDGQKGTLLNDSSNKLENDEFFFSSKEIVEKTVDATTKVETKKRFPPEMRLHLNREFFKTKLLDASKASNLANADLFKNYFRGLYFKVEKSGSSNSNAAMMDFKKGKITVFYKAKTAITTDDENVKENKTLVLNLTGNTVSLQEESNATPDYLDATQNDVVADDKLYLKGGQGSMAIIELNDFATQLADIKAKGWMVNEANLVFTIDSDKMKDLDEPLRVYLYDATNNTPIVDYIADGTTSLTGDTRRAKYIYDGIINLDATTKKGKTYKIRLTSYIRNLIKNDKAVAVKLGLVVTDDITIVASSKMDPKTINNSNFKEVPRASVMSQTGTVLFGGTAASADKKVKLQVYYTKPN